MRQVVSMERSRSIVAPSAVATVLARVSLITFDRRGRSRTARARSTTKSPTAKVSVATAMTGRVLPTPRTVRGCECASQGDKAINATLGAHAVTSSRASISYAVRRAHARASRLANDSW
jgi:hypothetical protein